MPAQVRRALPWLLLLAGAVVAALSFHSYNLDRLVAFGPTVAGGSIPTAEAQEPAARLLMRMILLFVAGLIVSPTLARSATAGVGRRPMRRSLGSAVGLAVLGLALLVARTAGESFVLSLNIDLRFLLALIVGTGVGALIGGFTEWALIRPLYERPIYQVLLTLGLVFVGTEFVKAIWGSAAYPPLARPSYFGGNCRSDNLLAWIGEHCASVNMLGRAFPTYRLFIIGVGVLVFVVVATLLRRSRLGMTIRAGVEDSEMVEALGINVRRVFTLVFALGIGAGGPGWGSGYAVPGLESGYGPGVPAPGVHCGRHWRAGELSGRGLWSDSGGPGAGFWRPLRGQWTPTAWHGGANTLFAGYRSRLDRTHHGPGAARATVRHLRE